MLEFVGNQPFGTPTIQVPFDPLHIVLFVLLIITAIGIIYWLTKERR